MTPRELIKVKSGKFSHIFVTLTPSKVLTFGKTQINLVFRSLSRTFVASNDY